MSLTPAGGSAMPHLGDHGSGIWHHPSTNRPTGTLGNANDVMANLRAATASTRMQRATAAVSRAIPGYSIPRPSLSKRIPEQSR